MFCPKCGSRIDGDFRFCPACGERIDPSLSEYLKETGDLSEQVESRDSLMKDSDRSSEESSYEKTEGERVSANTNDVFPPSSSPAYSRQPSTNTKTGSVFQKKKIWIAIIAAVVVIAAAVILIIVLNASSVDKGMVGLWATGGEDVLDASCLNIEKSGKCSGFHISFTGSTVAFRGECKTEDNVLTIELKEITSTYEKEEDVLSNDTTIGYYIAGYQKYGPVLTFTEVNSTGKGYFAKEVLGKDLANGDRVFTRTENKDAIESYKDVIDKWFTDSLKEGAAETVPQQETVTEPETEAASKQEKASDNALDYQQRVTLVPGTGGYQLILENLKGSNEWEKVFSCPAKISENGASTAYSENSGKTPEGTFKVLFYVGTKTPDTDLKCKTVKKGDVWVDDSSSKYYNTLQKGNFSGKDWNSSEDIYSYFSSGESNGALFFDYNGDGETAKSAVSGRGSVLFLFGRNDYKTAVSKSGDIYISAQDLTTLLSYLDSEKNPVITIQAAPVKQTLEMDQSFIDFIQNYAWRVSGGDGYDHSDRNDQESLLQTLIGFPGFFLTAYFPNAIQESVGSNPMERGVDASAVHWVAQTLFGVSEEACLDYQSANASRYRDGYYLSGPAGWGSFSVQFVGIEDARLDGEIYTVTMYGTVSDDYRNSGGVKTYTWGTPADEVPIKHKYHATFTRTNVNRTEYWTLLSIKDEGTY